MLKNDLFWGKPVLNITPKTKWLMMSVSNFLYTLIRTIILSVYISVFAVAMFVNHLLVELFKFVCVFYTGVFLL